MINEDFQERKNEIVNILSYLKYMEKERSTNDSIEKNMEVGDVDFNKLQKTIKASILLMLYNLVESTLTNCLNEIHDAITESTIPYNKLNNSIQTLFLAYHIESMKKTRGRDDQASIMRDLIFLLKEEGNISITYQELNSVYGLYSGNLDGKKVQSVLRRYGVEVSLHTQPLAEIRFLRNKLTHGELSFEDVGKDIHLGQIDDYVDKTIKHMEDVIRCVETFIQAKDYCKSR